MPRITVLTANQPNCRRLRLAAHLHCAADVLLRQAAIGLEGSSRLQLAIGGHFCAITSQCPADQPTNNEIKLHGTPLRANSQLQDARRARPPSRVAVWQISGFIKSTPRLHTTEQWSQAPDSSCGSLACYLVFACATWVALWEKPYTKKSTLNYTSSQLYGLRLFLKRRPMKSKPHPPLPKHKKKYTPGLKGPSCAQGCCNHSRELWQYCFLSRLDVSIFRMPCAKRRKSKVRALQSIWQALRAALRMLSPMLGYVDCATIGQFGAVASAALNLPWSQLESSSSNSLSRGRTLQATSF